MWDSGYNPSNNQTLYISVISINDEPPRLENTVFTVTYREEGGPINLLSPNSTLYDDDNCPEHRLVSEIRLGVGSFVSGEDILLDENGQEIDFGPFQNGSEVYYVTLTCNQTSNPECYNDLLRGLQYNNTADEPSSTNHNITIMVCELHHNTLQAF